MGPRLGSLLPADIIVTPFRQAEVCRRGECNGVTSARNLTVSSCCRLLQPIADAAEDRSRVGALFRSDHRIVGEPVQRPV
jgi:hypothetical protein